jgi:four helix bundle protein
MGNFRDLIAFQKGFDNAMEIYRVAMEFPEWEKYSLVSQITRSSRSVCHNLAEGYRKRQYPAHYSSKISDADSENLETIISLDFALACNYIDQETYNKLISRAEEVGKLIGYMLAHPEKFGVKKKS